ncbi:MAG: hypothetical protein IJ748_04280 [Bacteroidales bacterium]|nr:hypothetical protein [Bacteroidales bacterium]
MTIDDIIRSNTDAVSKTEKAYQNIYKMRNKALMNMFVRQSTVHKNQYVATICGVSFFDDAFALSPNATWFTFYQSTSSVVWILENLGDSDIDFSEQLDVIKDKVEQIVIIDSEHGAGINTEQLRKVSNVSVVSSMKEAVEHAYHIAAKDMAVIYSPASGIPETAQERAKEFSKNVHSL